MAYNYNPYNNNTFQGSQPYPYPAGYGAQPSMVGAGVAPMTSVVIREDPHHHHDHHHHDHHHDHHHHDHHHHDHHHHDHHDHHDHHAHHHHNHHGC